MKTSFHFNCPNCGQDYESEADLGASFQCQKCDFFFAPNTQKEEVIEVEKPAAKTRCSTAAEALEKEAERADSSANMMGVLQTTFVFLGVVIGCIVGVLTKNFAAGATVFGSILMLSCYCTLMRRLALIHSVLLRIRGDTRSQDEN